MSGVAGASLLCLSNRWWYRAAAANRSSTGAVCDTRDLVTSFVMPPPKSTGKFSSPWGSDVQVKLAILIGHWISLSKGKYGLAQWHQGNAEERILKIQDCTGLVGAG